MENRTLVISNPPHRHEDDIDLDTVSRLLGLDIYVTRLKAKFSAPEILSAAEPNDALRFAAGLRNAGLSISVQSGNEMGDPDWPLPVSTLILDESGVRAGADDDTVHIRADEEVFGVYCRPPEDFRMEAAVDPKQAIASGHGPTIAEAIQWMGILDLYTRASGELRRVTIVPELLDLDPDKVVSDVTRKLRGLEIDRRLEGVRPRGRFVMGEGDFDPDQRKRYSYGTLLLCHILESISPELRNITHYEFGSRLAYSMGSMSP